jgi:hypothetical protein
MDPALSPFWETLPQDQPDRSNVSLGPQGGFVENLTAQYWADETGQRTNSSSIAEHAARDENIKAIESRTGKPWREVIEPYFPAIRQKFGVDPERGFNQPGMFEMAMDLAVDDLRQQGSASGLLKSAELRARAHELAMEADVEAADVAARSPGLSATIARFAGSAGSSVTDPVNILLMPFGAAGRAGIAATAGIEGALGGAASAATMPWVERWRKEAGLSTLTDDEKAGRVATDAAVSAATGGLIKGVGRILSPRKAVEAFDRVFPKRDDAPLDARRMRNELETLAELAEDNPLGDSPRAEAEHFRRLADVADAVSEDRPLPKFAEDRIAPELPKKRARGNPVKNRPINVMERVAQLGGVRDAGGEAAARDLNARSTMTAFGPAVRKNGMSADEMRHILVSEGYLRDDGARFGTVGQTTEHDVFELLGRQKSGDQVVREADIGWADEVRQARLAEAGEDELMTRWETPEERDIIRNFGVDNGNQVIRFFGDNQMKLADWHPDDLTLAADLMRGGLAPELAFERAAIMNVEGHFQSLSDDAARLVRDAEMGDIPGWERTDGPDSQGRVDAESRGADAGDPGGTGGQGLPAGERAPSRGGGEAAGETRGQQSIPGTGEVNQKRLAERRAAQPMRGNAGQNFIMDEGLFGDGMNQRDMFDMRPPADDAPLPSPAQARMAADATSEPDDIAAMIAEADGFAAELRVRMDEGLIGDDAVLAASDGRFATAKDFFDDLDREAEFLEAVKVCLQ